MVGVGVSALFAPLVGGAVWEVQVSLDLSLVLYIVLLLVAKRRRAELQSNAASRQGRLREEVHFFEPVRAGSAGN
jgi:hypothetical protein